MPRKPKATRPKAKIGVANINFSGMMAMSDGCMEKRHARNIRTMMQRPIQNAEKFPATKPDRIFSEAPPCFEQLVTSFTWREFVLVKTLVNSGMTAPAMVPQLMMAESTHQRSGCGVPLASRKSPRRNLLATNVTAIETAEVS